MCRLLGVALKDKDVFTKLFKALVESSRYDHIAASLPRGFSSHNDGWGYALEYFHGEVKLAIYKTKRPVWEDEEMWPLFAEPPIVGFVHTRKASKNTPINTFSAHPFVVMASDGSLIAVSQNGGISKRAVEFLRKTDIKPDDVSDTLIFAKLLEESYGEAGGDPPERIGRALVRLACRLGDAGYAGGCMNTMVLHVHPRSTSLAVLRFIKRKRDDRLRYCELYSAEGRWGRAYFSSTLAEKLGMGKPFGRDRVVIVARVGGEWSEVFSEDL